MRSFPLALLLAASVPVSSCRGHNPGDPFPKIRPADLIVKELTVTGSSVGPAGTTAIDLEIRIANVRPAKGIGTATHKPFKVSIVLRNPHLEVIPPPPPPGKDPLVFMDIAAPLAFGLVGLATMPLEDQPVSDKDLTVKVPLLPGQSHTINRTAYVIVPWDLPNIDSDGNSVPLELTATVDWENAIKERNEKNNSLTIPLGQ